MKRISVSELQNNPTQALSELPVEIVRYGKTVAIIVSPEERGDRLENFSEKKSNGRSITAMVVDEASNMTEEQMDKIEESFLPEYTPGFCTKCHKKAEVKSVEYNDAEGNEYKETLCRKHVKSLEVFLNK